MANKRVTADVQQEHFAATTILNAEPTNNPLSHVLPPKETGLFPSLEGRPLPTTIVNNSSLGEVKVALDDAVKKVCSTFHSFGYDPLIVYHPPLVDLHDQTGYETALDHLARSPIQ
jgi:hypothetical protein